MLHYIGLLASAKGVDEESLGSRKLPGLSFIWHQNHTSAAQINGVHTPPCAPHLRPARHARAFLWAMKKNSKKI